MTAGKKHLHDVSPTAPKVFTVKIGDRVETGKHEAAAWTLFLRAANSSPLGTDIALLLRETVVASVTVGRRPHHSM